MQVPLSIFRANDIRGVYLTDFDLTFCRDLAKSLSFLLQKQEGVSRPKILLGYDARLSSPEIAVALKQSLLASGADVACIGVAPSPLCYFLLQHYDFSATVVITASHNPAEYNGFKFLISKKLNLPEPIQLLKEIYSNKAFLNCPQTKGSEFEIDEYAPYIDSLKKEFSIKAVPFIIDTGNGALGPLAKRVFKSLNLEPDILFCEPDGRFPNHHPDPTIDQNLIQLKKHLKKSDSLFGIGFDGDGDRLVLVTRNGQTVLGDDLAFVFLPSLLKKQKEHADSPPIIADVKCSDWFFQFCKEQKGTVIMNPSGHSLMRQEMEKRNGLAAFEFSGHFFFNDRKERGFDDALYAVLRLLELLDGKDQVDSLLPKIPTVRTPELRLPLGAKQVEEALQTIRKYLTNKQESFISLDGIRISRETSWALFRHSKTQDALTMRFEAQNQKDLNKLKEEFASLIGISIP